ncbi:hypothetical protein ALC62_12404 [Cyphomyrmex costatus]|uniref:Uncharacterized protein n=1 Tax=Cyphomyrmex costatus TaxID=456900 RepID=A0A151IBA2_9HYME|nr:hypothetical protein ALC62_12404 [Cyphomyrmex costatus]
MSRPRLDYALTATAVTITVGPLLLALLTFTCAPTVSGKYIKFSVLFVYPATAESLPHVNGGFASLLGNRNARNKAFCALSLLSVSKISTTIRRPIACDRVQLHELCELYSAIQTIVIPRNLYLPGHSSM